jgi:BirA family biotin operon repressor/biotin-[acetyl-CoA-carboxylase] ligase
VPGQGFDVKWPNDVLHGGRKLCGILAETRVGAAESVPLVIGFGVNVNQTNDAWPEAIGNTATSLRIAADGRALDCDTVLREILARFDVYHSRIRAGDFSGLWNSVRARLPRPGTPVVVTSGAHRVEGVVEGYTDRGAITVRDREGVVLTLAAGEIIG